MKTCTVKKLNVVYLTQSTQSTEKNSKTTKNIYILIHRGNTYVHCIFYQI